MAAGEELCTLQGLLRLPDLAVGPDAGHLRQCPGAALAGDEPAMGPGR